MKIRVGVIFGGASVEHEVSIISALQAISNLNKDKYDVVPIYISKEKAFYTGNNLLDINNYKDLDNLIKNAKEISIVKIKNEFALISTKKLFNKVIDKIDIALPIVHGKNVEDGTLAGYLETLGIPYANSGVLGSALGQDKVVLKQVLKSANINVVDYISFYDFEYELNEEKYKKQIDELGYPVVVKPSNLGSSVGIKFVKNKKEISDAINDAIKYDKKILIEKAVENLKEVNCSVIGNYKIQTTSLIEEVLSDNEILTYKDKYIGNKKTKGSKGMVNASRIIPANISKELESKVETLSKETFKALNLSGICRIDFLIDEKSNKVYVNEPNVIPGSLSFYLWEGKGKKYSELLDDLLTIAIKEYKGKNNKTTQFDTNILSNFNGIKSIKK
ncbi:MAG: D-alanine--D-alanine ligase [Bacilli bacterium]|nr:D-alanine--D-alanine ligase [Bacilli bacterium]